MAYINYMAIDARCIVKEAQLMGSALDRLARNTDLRYDELCNRTAVKQIKDALGSKKIKDKGARQGAKHLVKLLTAIYPEKDGVSNEDKSEEVVPALNTVVQSNNADAVLAVESAVESAVEAVLGGENV